MTDCLLSGLRALDLTDEKGVLCGKILADLGVDVIKIEKPGGDPMRSIPPFYHNEHDPEKSLYWFAYNTNKQSITLNLETSRGQDLFRALVKRADFVIESFPPGYMAQLGLDYTQLAQINSWIIMTSVTAFGQSGPYSRFKASDLVLQSMGVMLSQHGDPDRAPVRISIPQSFMHAGADAAVGTLVAHYYRGITGEGQHVDVSIMESLVWAEGIATAVWEASKKDVQRAGRSVIWGGLVSLQHWECKDGYVTFTLQASILGAADNRKLSDWMYSEQLLPDFLKVKDWSSWDWSKTTQSEMNMVIEAFSAFFKSHTMEELHTGARKRGITLYKVSTLADICKDEQLKDRDFWVNIEHDRLNSAITYPGAFAKFSVSPITNWHRAPFIGEHNIAVYQGELGLSEEETKSLERNGII